jgi:competence protein ComFC
MYLFSKFLDILFPKSCVGCNKTGSFFCDTCRQNTPKPYEQLEGWIHSLFRYRHKTVRDVIWLLKYRNGHAVAKDLAPYMYDEIIELLTEKMTGDSKILLIPIPMTAKKKRARGFNQSEILAKEIWKQNKGFFTYTEALKKTRETTPQAKITNKAKRLQNMRGVFSCKNKSLVAGRTVVLVDDITTTGATLKEARKALKQSGVKKIFAITIGH